MAYPQPPSTPALPTAAPNSYLFPPIGLLVCGILGVVGGLLPWVTITVSLGPISQSVSGGQDEDAWIAVLISVALLLCAAIYLFGQRRGRGILIGAGVFALAVFGFGLWKIIKLYSDAHNAFAQLDDINVGDVPNAPPDLQLPNFDDLFHINPGPGLWMVTASGLVGAILALVTILRKQPPAVAGQPFGQPGPGQAWPTPVPAAPVQATPVAPMPAPLPAAAPAQAAPEPDVQWIRPETPPEPAAYTPPPPSYTPPAPAEPAAYTPPAPAPYTPPADPAPYTPPADPAPYTPPPAAAPADTAPEHRPDENPPA